MEFTMTARMQGQAEDYTPLAENQLEARLEQLNGDGSAANPIPSCSRRRPVREWNMIRCPAHGVWRQRRITAC